MKNRTAWAENIKGINRSCDITLGKVRGADPASWPIDWPMIESRDGLRTTG